eukprot:4520372-Pleurochrysis_carterae.AAC.4
MAWQHHHTRVHLHHSRDLAHRKYNLKFVIFAKCHQLLAKLIASLWLVRAPLYEIGLGVMTRRSPAPTLLCPPPDATTLLCPPPDATMWAHCGLTGGRLGGPDA